MGALLAYLSQFHTFFLCLHTMFGYTLCMCQTSSNEEFLHGTQPQQSETDSIRIEKKRKKTQRANIIHIFLYKENVQLDYVRLLSSILKKLFRS